MNVPAQPAIRLSIVISAYNEGAEVRRTLESIAANTNGPFEILLVDDGSTDGCCDDLEARNLQILRHAERIGVAHSRNEASRLARGDVLAFLDAHQRLSPACLNHCAAAALEYQAIIWPDVRDLEDRGWTGHGAFLRLCKQHGYFTADWNNRIPRDGVSRITSLIAPGYVMPREVYGKVFWIDALRGWGASEAAVTVKAFFQDIDILHLCGPVARHLFRKGREIPYSASWESVWRNQALIARVCFDDQTWYEHWLPHVFYKHLTPAVRYELESPAIVAEHEAFLALKKRPDREFWRGVLRTEEPACLRP